jgi:hypothetical protein
MHCPEQAAVAAPIAEPYVPAGQTAVHDADDKPSVEPYSPALQSVQLSAPPTLYLPKGHMNAVEFTEPMPHLYPALHTPEHVALDNPVVEPYSPAAQLVHDPAPAKLYVPSEHMAAVELVDPAAQLYPAVHTPVHVAVMRPALAPYVPELQ